MRIVVVGDILLDRDLDGRALRLCPDAPAPVIEDIEIRERPGGAGLAAELAVRDGHAVTLVTAVGDNPAGHRATALLEADGITVVDIGHGGVTPEKVRIRAGGQVIARLDHGGRAPDVPSVPPDARRAIAAADAVLVSDYGRGLTAADPVRRALKERVAPLVWDPHPRGARPVEGVDLFTPNAAEAAGMTTATDTAAQACRLLAMTGARAVAVTVGVAGAVFAEPDRPVLAIPAPLTSGGDACGAGDRLASAAAAALGGGCPAGAAVVGAVAKATDFVSAGGASAALRGPVPTPVPDASTPAVVARVRAAGGCVVATGGCFDLLHAGHVAMLESARALGDCLVVLVNSDASVRRLKGSDRPLVAQEDRLRVLAALRSVDAVVLFEEDTPERALAELTPDIFAKGGDYDPEALPEAAVVRRAGGRVVGLPYTTGRSTSRLIQEVANRVTR